MQKLSQMAAFTHDQILWQGKLIYQTMEDVLILQLGEFRCRTDVA